MTDQRSEFMAAAFWHGSLPGANAILVEHPEISKDADIHIAAILGDDETVVRRIAEDPARVHTKSGPHLVDPLTCLCARR